MYKKAWLVGTSMLAGLVAIIMLLTLGNAAVAQSAAAPGLPSTQFDAEAGSIADTNILDSPGAISPLSASVAHTWTHTTRADWKQGTLVWLDSTTISGSLQLAQRVLGDSERVSAGAGTDQKDPVVVAHPTLTNTLYAAWEDHRNDHQDIYFARSTDGGSTWQASVRVNDDSSNVSQYDPTIAIGNDGTLYLAWTDERNGDADIYTARSADGGATWSQNVQVNDDAINAKQSQPTLVCDGGDNLYLAWRDKRKGS